MMCVKIANVLQIRLPLWKVFILLWFMKFVGTGNSFLFSNFINYQLQQNKHMVLKLRLPLHVIKSEKSTYQCKVPTPWNNELM